MVTKRLKETTVASTLAVANFRVTESPIVVPDAVSPRKVQVLGLALAAGLIFGLGAAFGLEILKPVSPTSVAAPATFPELPILAELPATAYEPLVLAFDCASHRHTPECAAFRTLRSSLSFLRHDQESRSIAITSATEDGETSFCALNLAATYAGENLKTLLIVADCENFELERVLIDPARGPVRGLYDGLANSLQPDSFCHATPIPNLYFIPAGRPVTDPQALLQSENFRDLMIRAWTSVDRIILCAPPVMEMQEPLVPLQFAEAVCLVAKSGRTSKAQLSAAVARLRFPNHAPAGLVMTSASPRIMSGRGSFDPQIPLHAEAGSHA
jgi:Mrp family chromosome partitioning ATPase